MDKTIECKNRFAGLTALFEASAAGRSFRDWSFLIDEEKQHLAFCYDHNSGTCSVLTWDTFEEFAEYWGTEVGDWLGLATCEPETVCSDGACVYFKVK